MLAGRIYKMSTNFELIFYYNIMQISGAPRAHSVSSIEYPAMRMKHFWHLLRIRNFRNELPFTFQVKRWKNVNSMEVIEAQEMSEKQGAVFRNVIRLGSNWINRG